MDTNTPEIQPSRSKIVTCPEEIASERGYRRRAPMVCLVTHCVEHSFLPLTRQSCPGANAINRGGHPHRYCPVPAGKSYYQGVHTAGKRCSASGEHCGCYHWGRVSLYAAAHLQYSVETPEGPAFTEAEPVSISTKPEIKPE